MQLAVSTTMGVSAIAKDIYAAKQNTSNEPTPVKIATTNNHHQVI